MGYSAVDIGIDAGIKAARKGCLVSWDQGLTRKIVPLQVIKAELTDDNRVFLYYSSSKGRPGGHRLVQEFDVGPRCKKLRKRR